MTNTNIFAMTELAEASYGEFPNATPSQIQVGDALRAKGFADTQITDLQRNYAVIHHRPNTNRGFSATLFQSLDPSNPGLTLALRGTEPGSFSDVISADLGGIVITGAALYQIVDLYNYWIQLTAGQNATARLARIVSTTDSNASGIFATVVGGTPSDPQVSYRRIEFFDQSNAGLGVITGSVTGLTVTGHSLGGHLATAFERLFPGTVGAAYTVNGAGTRETTEVSLFFDALAERLTAFDASKVVNIYGSAGPNVVSGELVYDQIGSRVELFTESIMDAFGHGNKQMTDSAAVYDLFIRVDSQSRSGTPAEALAKLKPLFEAASVQAGSSLEGLVDSLVKLFGLDFTPLADGKVSDREALYERIVPLHTIAVNLSASNPGMVIDVLVNTAAADLASIAQGSTAFGYRYALRELNPFAILGNNDLYGPHNQNGELDLYDPTSRTGTLAVEWITDRAAFLAWKNQYFTTDGVTLRGTRDENYLFEDRDTAGKADLSLTVVGNLAAGGNSGAAANPAKVVFGNTGTDVITGGILSDRLYGDAGTDWLEGKGNSDYLEGGLGLDIYNYNAFSGLLSGNDGADVIRDIDGKGVLRYVYRDGTFANPQGTVIADASVQVSGTQWNSADGRFTYTRSQNDLIIAVNDGTESSITLKDFRDGDFSIHLWQFRADPQNPVRTFFGDKEDWDSDPNQDGLQPAPDGFGNYLRADGQDGRPDIASPAREDFFYGSASTEVRRFLLGEGNDRVRS